MELKSFQHDVLTAVDNYIQFLIKQRSRALKLHVVSSENPELDIPPVDYTEETWQLLGKAGKLPRARSEVPFSVRRDGIGMSVPNITLKIPTGGGKTLLAANSVSRIMNSWLNANQGFVLWIVPSETIYSQTLSALKDREHPYRQVLDRSAGGRVKILEKHSALRREDVDSHLCIMLLMLQSANRETKESLKIFKDRGNVHGFFPTVDDYEAHSALLDRFPNLDVYGDKSSLGCTIKESLGNALRVTQPIVVLDEGHKGYSYLALDTLYGFNPCFVLELSATPIDRVRREPRMYSNWLVDIDGTTLANEEMIKLPINVTIRADGDWRSCLRNSFEHLNELQIAAERLHAESSRYIRPICLVQVERTGFDQREVGHIHADDAKDYLLQVGVREQEIAIKTSSKNDLKAPENLNLLAPTNQVRFIITKQALQEGWDCPFAYTLCSLSMSKNKSAMAQLVGRILRQPHTEKTGLAALDQCYVFCIHPSTFEVVDTIKRGLEEDGLADIAHLISGVESDEGHDGTPRKLQRRGVFRDLQIYLPVVNWIRNGSVRPLHYERDILYRIDWQQVNVDSVVDLIPNDTAALESSVVQLGLETDPHGKRILRSRTIQRSTSHQSFDPVHVTRSIGDIVPNPWIARSYVERIIGGLRRRGIRDSALGALGHLVLESLRVCLHTERDRLAEALFLEEVRNGRIQFRLRTDSHNWLLPDELRTTRASDSRRLRRPDGDFARKGLFEAIYDEDFNGYEKLVAGYLDSHAALHWWHRNVAQQQYSLQGWRRDRVFPDFIFAIGAESGSKKLMILETKGDHLDNRDTKYKQDLMNTFSEVFQVEQVRKCGELELVFDESIVVRCELIFEAEWKTHLAKLLQ